MIGHYADIFAITCLCFDFNAVAIFFDVILEISQKTVQAVPCILNVFTSAIIDECVCLCGGESRIFCRNKISYELIRAHTLRISSHCIDKFLEFFEIEEEFEDSDITTFSGFVAHNLGEIPDEGSFEYRNLKITITETEANRLVSAQVEVTPKLEDEEEKED